MDDKRIETTIALMLAQQERIQADIDEIKAAVKALKEQFVTKDEFWPVRTIVYGLVAITFTAVIGSLLALVMRGGGL